MKQKTIYLGGSYQWMHFFFFIFVCFVGSWRSYEAQNSVHATWSRTWNAIEELIYKFRAETKQIEAQTTVERRRSRTHPFNPSWASDIAAFLVRLINISRLQLWNIKVPLKSRIRSDIITHDFSRIGSFESINKIGGLEHRSNEPMFTIHFFSVALMLQTGDRQWSQWSSLRWLIMNFNGPIDLAKELRFLSRRRTNSSKSSVAAASLRCNFLTDNCERLRVLW